MSVLITAAMLSEIHRQAIDTGAHDEAALRDAVRDEATVYYIAERAGSISDELEQAAFLLFAIAHYHPFVEGNKRTALLAAILVLPTDIFAGVDESEINEKVRHIAADGGTLEESLAWLQACAHRD